MGGLNVTLENAFIVMMRSVVREELAALADQPSPGDSEFISLQAAARRANVSEKTLRRWIKGGLLKAALVGRMYRVRTRELDAMLTRFQKTDDDQQIVDRILRGARRLRRR
jgi:excisionase family DNA binding protein